MACVSNAEITVLKQLSAENLTAGLITQKPIVLKMTIPDFSYPDRKLAIYLDGVQVHTKNKVEARDEEIDNLLERQGWTVLRIRYYPPLTQQSLNDVMNKIRYSLGAEPKR